MKTLEELIKLYKFYSGRYVDSVCNHEDEMTVYYFDKVCDVLVCAKSNYSVDLNDVDLSETI